MRRRVGQAAVRRLGGWSGRLALVAGVAAGVVPGIPAAAQNPQPSRTIQGSARFATSWLESATLNEEQLVVLTSDRDPRTRQLAVMRIGELDPTDARLTILVRALSDPLASVRNQAAASLMRLDEAATPILVRALSNVSSVQPLEREWRNLRVSDLAFTVLANTKRPDIGALLKAYRAEKPSVNPSANLDELERAAQRAGEASYRPIPVRTQILKALGHIDGRADAELLDVLSGNDEPLAVAAAGLIGRAGTDAEPAVPALTRAIRRQRSGAVRDATASALARIPSSGTVALRGLLEDPNPSARRAAISTYPIRDAALRTAVAQALRDRDAGNRAAALRRVAYFESTDAFSSRDTCQSRTEPLFAQDIPATLLRDLTASTRDSSADVRSAAIQALASIACQRRDVFDTAVTVFDEALTDPDQNVRDAAVRSLAQLVESGFVYAVQGAHVRLLGLLNRASDDNTTHRDVLELLTRVPIPDSARDDALRVLLRRCLEAAVLCGPIAGVIRSKPGWAEATYRALVTQNASSPEFDEQAFELLGLLASDSSFYRATLERLLARPEETVRLRAAILLANQGFTTASVREILEPAALKFTGVASASVSSDAANALALDEIGVERLAALVETTTVPIEVRLALMNDSLARVTSTRTRAADVIIRAATGSIDRRLQWWALWLLPSLEGRDAAVRGALQSALEADESEVRSAALAMWNARGLPPQQAILERMLLDDAPSVRRTALGLLVQVTATVPQREALLRRALNDRDEEVRDRALQLAADVGPGAQVLLSEFVEAGNELTDTFFSSTGRLGVVTDRLAEALERRYGDASDTVRQGIDEIFARLGPMPAGLIDRLYQRLDSNNDVIRNSAAQTLLEMNEDPWSRGGVLAAVLMDAQIHKIITARLAYAIDALYGPFLKLGGVTTATLPVFPWPPPAGYSPTEIPTQLLALNSTSTLGDVHRTLVASLEAASSGFSQGTFGGPPDGFAIVARMERVSPDGTPLPGRARWIKDGRPVLSLIEFLGDLFFERPGNFRVIVFAVTSDVNPGANRRAPLPEPGQGAVGLPPELANQSYANRTILALVYSFARRANVVEPWSNGAPSAREHLLRSGVWSALGRR
jgi:HEAT repeats